MTLPRLCAVTMSALALFAPLVRAAEPTTTQKRPNILLIISDDLRAELGCYGGKAKTPNLDALAASGARFDKAYCQYPLCNPSRVSMLTGRHPVTTRIFGNRTDFRTLYPDWVSLPQHFRQNGYVTLRAGKIFHGGIDDPRAWSPQLSGSSRNVDTEEEAAAPSRQPATQMTRAQYSDRFIVLDADGEAHGDYRTAARTIESLRRCKESGEPFFIACGFVKPHSPPSAPQCFYDMYPLEQIELPPDFAARPTVPDGFPKGSIRPRNADLFIGRDATPEDAKRMIRAYLASTSWVDMLAGKVIDELDRLGLRENTIIVFWGDHGYQLGEKGKWSKAGSVWEKGTRVPLIIAAPGPASTGRACARVVQSIDIYPTLVELCGLPAVEGLEGRSLVPLLSDPGRAWDHPAFSVWSEDGKNLTAVAVRTERWRYAEFDGGRGGAMLLEPERDPHAVKNLADDPAYAQVRRELSTLVKDYASRLK